MKERTKGRTRLSFVSYFSLLLLCISCWWQPYTLRCNLFHHTVHSSFLSCTPVPSLLKLVTSPLCFYRTCCPMSEMQLQMPTTPYAVFIWHSYHAADKKQTADRELYFDSCRDTSSASVADPGFNLRYGGVALYLMVSFCPWWKASSPKLANSETSRWHSSLLATNLGWIISANFGLSALPRHEVQTRKRMLPSSSEGSMQEREVKCCKIYNEASGRDREKES